VDFEGHSSEPRVQEALARLQEDCIFLKVLGSYAKVARSAEA
jgi:prephenate dehydratase